MIRILVCISLESDEIEFRPVLTQPTLCEHAINTGPVSVRLSVRLSVTRQYCSETDEQPVDTETFFNYLPLCYNSCRPTSENKGHFLLEITRKLWTIADCLFGWPICHSLSLGPRYSGPCRSESAVH